MIGEGFAEHPKLPEPFPINRKMWVCPKTGMKVPKQYDAHMEWREKLLKKADRDPVLQNELMAVSKKSLRYFVNAFVWTRHEYETDPDTGKQAPAIQTHWPFNTWEIQDEAFDWIEDRFNQGEDGMFDKSREMGASWLCLIFNHWLWLFRPDTQIREMSRVENLVDDGSTDSLFGKHDYINSWLPHWMCPPGVLVRGKGSRTNLKLHNELNGADINGAATSKYALRAGRCAILLLDEFAAAENGQSIRTSTTSVAPCRIVNSTTIGAGTEYARWKKSGQIKVFGGLKFWNHPDKGKGRFVMQDSVTKRYEITSPYMEKKKLRSSPKELAQEEYGVDLEAGDTFFSLAEIDKHKALFARPVKSRYNIILKKGVANDQISQILRQRKTSVVSCVAAKEGKLEVWVELINKRPDQSKTYLFGIDISKGQGASESVVSIKCKQTGEIIVKWKCRHTPPYEFARIIIALALWCGGSNSQRLPYLKWENNGPGWDLGHLLVHEFKYPHYYCSDTVGRVGVKKSDKYGYHMSRESKVLLLRAYERALMTGQIINHDKRGLEQAKYYIYYPGGGVGPAELTDKAAAERLLHGDIVIADALTIDDKEVAQPKEKLPVASHQSWQGRYEAWQKSQKKAKGWRKPYDFTK